MAWLHTWMGLVLGWLLYFMFVTGTAGYLDTEIDRWMMPEAPPAVQGGDAISAARLGLDWLAREAPAAHAWSVSLPVDRNTPYLRVFWRGEARGDRGRAELDAATGEPIEARDTGGGQRLYRMHWRLQYLPDDVVAWLISIATLFMFVAMVTGVIVHKKIFKDFFTFRPGKGQRSWLDAHNAVSVLSLPFQLMITYSGLIFMMFTCMPLHTDEQFVDSANARAIPSWNRIDLGARYVTAVHDTDVTLRLRVNNVLDDRYWENAGLALAEPRNVSLSMSLRF